MKITYKLFRIIDNKLYPLSYRAGWHSSNLPKFEHITSADKSQKWIISDNLIVSRS